MSIQIGKLLPDGSVRHIKALHETLSKDLVRKLRVFYPNDRRVDALLSLGDIQKLGPSPYGNGQEPAIPSTVFQRSVTDGKHRGNPHHASRTTQTFSAAWRTRASCSITADGMSWTRENTVNSRSSSKIRPPMTA